MMYPNAEALIIWSFILSVIMYAGPAVVSVFYVLNGWRKEDRRATTRPVAEIFHLHLRRRPKIEKKTGTEDEGRRAA